MPFDPLPPAAAWAHRQARTGFEVVHFRRLDDGFLAAGSTSAVEAGDTWIVDYEIEVDASGCTRRAAITSRSQRGTARTVVESDGAGAWRVDGLPAPQLDGCLDVDLESSALTNAFPVRRLALRPGDRAAAPAAYVRALGLGVDRLDQHYTRLSGDAGRRYAYAAPVFDFACELAYDASGLVLDYPGIAVRAA